MPRENALAIAVACSGLDHVERGYERFSRRFAQFLGSQEEFEVTLIKGSGRRNRSERVLRVPRRDSGLLRRLAWLPGRRTNFGPPAGGRSGLGVVGAIGRAIRGELPISSYEIESAAFGLRLALWALRARPDVVVLHDVVTARVLSAVAHVSGRSVPVLFINGAPWPPPYEFADLVVQLTPSAAKQRGSDAARAVPEVVLPCPVDPPPPSLGRQAARARLGHSDETFLVVSVGALNDHHKRHCWTIGEVAGIESAHLLIAGARDPEEHVVREAAARFIPGRHTILTLDHQSVADVLDAADVFVLASVTEGFGLASVEAGMAGLPVIVHGGDVQRWVLGESAQYVDMTAKGELRSALNAMRQQGRRGIASEAATLRDRLSWQRLGPEYAEAVRRVAATR